MTMGNRAVMDFGNGTGIYLHWNGGRESIQGFLRAAKDLGVRGAGDLTYSQARITQIIANFFGGTTSIGTGPLSSLDCESDNGVFKIKGFEITEGASSDLPTEEAKEYEQGVYEECMRINAPIFGVKLPQGEPA